MPKNDAGTFGNAVPKRRASEGSSIASSLEITDPADFAAWYLFQGSALMVKLPAHRSMQRR